MFNLIFKEKVQGQKHQRSLYLQNQNNLKEDFSIDQKVINGHKNPSDSHNYHDENHDGIEFYLGNSDRSTWWHWALEQRTPKNQSDWLYSYGVLFTNVTGTYIHTMTQRILEHTTETLV